MITNPEYTGVEVRDPAESNSESARGFDDSYWKEVKGPSDIEKWINEHIALCNVIYLYVYDTILYNMQCFPGNVFGNLKLT